MTTETLIKVDGWEEGRPCPMSVSRMSCTGTLKLEVEGDHRELVCSDYPVYHFKVVPQAIAAVLE